MLGSEAPRHTPIGRISVAIALITFAGCGGAPPSPERPTYERVAVNDRAVGIPYGPVVVFKVDDQLIAFRVSSVPLSGYGIEYEWTAAPAGAALTATATGAGAVEEKPQPVYIRAGPLAMQWSRGSQKYGWLYWPEDAHPTSVCAITFRSFESINLQDPRVFWYTQEMFE
jgi:hypothetical protein